MIDSFTRDYRDNSREVGFEFVFYCDLCHCGYYTSFIKAEAYKRMGIVGRILYKISSSIRHAKINFFNTYPGQNTEKAAERFNKLDPGWHKEHEHAFEQAQDEGKMHFNRCLKCFRWVCDNDFNIGEGMCVKCAPNHMSCYDGRQV